MNERETAHAELQHVIAALDDQFGGLQARGLSSVNARLRPIVVSYAVRLSQRSVAGGWASCALRNADVAITTAGIVWHHAGYIPALRKLAPLLLDVYLDAKGVE